MIIIMFKSRKQCEFTEYKVEFNYIIFVESPSIKVLLIMYFNV